MVNYFEKKIEKKFRDGVLCEKFNFLLRFDVIFKRLNFEKPSHFFDKMKAFKYLFVNFFFEKNFRGGKLAEKFNFLLRYDFIF